MSQKLNEKMIRALLENLTQEEAIKQIAEAMTVRDNLIKAKKVA